MNRLAMACVLLMLAASPYAQEYNGPTKRAAMQSTDRIIVQWRASQDATAPQQKVRALGLKAKANLNLHARVGPRTDVLKLERRLIGAELAETLSQLNADPAVEFAAPDFRRQAHALPNDALVSSQWYLLDAEISALRAEAAWNITTGSTGTVVAVLDTGIRYDHPDLLAASSGGKLLPGYDFVSGESSSSFLAANDGDGHDSDPSDPGDWVSSSDVSNPVFDDCELSDSSWHGTRVAGVIAARSGNAVGIAGVAWNAWILPVRVLGKCGGRDSDIMAAMRWAGGLEVPGIPTNPYPAKIINLSLGGSSTCTSAYQSIVSELAARGVLIVASAGNEGGFVSAPANCTGVLGVTGVRHVGTKVGFSNLGPAVDIAAPGGNCVNVNGGPCLFSIVTTTNQGRTGPGASAYTDSVNFNVGTSFSAPLVAGAAALMHAVNAHLGPEELTARIRQGASSFPPVPNPTPTDPPICRVPTSAGDTQLECYCTTQTCGAGLLNANGAVSQALRPAAAIEVTGTVAPGQTLSLDANQSVAACNRTLSAFEWGVVAPAPNAPTLSSTNQATTTIQAPSSGEVRVRLTVTDDVGAQDFVDLLIGPTSTSTASRTLVAGPACPAPITVSQTPAPSPAPPTPAPAPPSNGGGGGGGQLNTASLALLLFLLAMRRFVSRSFETTLSSR